MQDWEYSDDDAPDAPPPQTRPHLKPVDLAAVRELNDQARKLQQELELKVRWPAIGVAGIFAPLEPIDYLVQALDICPGAPTLLAAYGFSGKTMVTQSMALSIASGSLLWDKFPCKQGRVLHIDYEQGERLSRDRYQRLARGMQLTPADLGDRLSLVSMPQHYMDMEGSEAFMLKACEGFNLAIVDSFRACSPTVDENDSEARLVLDKLTRVSEKTGCCFIVIHHARKPARDGSKGGGAMMDVRGSGALFDACACVLHLTMTDKDDDRTLKQSKARNRGTKMSDVAIDIYDVPDGDDERAGLVVRARDILPAGMASYEKTPAADNDQFRDAIIRCFRKDPEPKSKNAIAAACGLRRSSVLGAVDLMTSKAELVAVRQGNQTNYTINAQKLVQVWE